MPWPRRIVDLAVPGAAAAVVVGFGIAAAMPADVDMYFTVESTGATVEDAVHEAFDMCANLGYARDGRVNWKDTYSDGTARVEVACVNATGMSPLMVAGHGEATTEAGAVEEGKAECLRQGYPGFTVMDVAEVPMRRFRSEVACHRDDATASGETAWSWADASPVTGRGPARPTDR